MLQLDERSCALCGDQLNHAFSVSKGPFSIKFFMDLFIGSYFLKSLKLYEIEHKCNLLPTKMSQ